MKEYDSESKSNYMCWSCGKSQENCSCSKEEKHFIKPPIQPKEALPICGVLQDEDLPSYLNQAQKDEIISRPCCQCNQHWECTRDVWINGDCPHCGASGTGFKDLKKTSMDLVDPELEEILDIDFFLKKLEDYSKTQTKKVIGDEKFYINFHNSVLNKDS